MKFARHDSEKNNKKKTIKHYIFVRDDMLKFQRVNVTKIKIYLVPISLQKLFDIAFTYVGDDTRSTLFLYR